MNELQKEIDEPAASMSINTQQPAAILEETHESQYKILYEEAVNIYDEWATKLIQRKIMNSLKLQQNVSFLQNFVNQFTLKVEQESINKEVIVFNAQWGNFSINIKILNIEGCNTKHSFIANHGAFGHISYGSFNNKSFVMKCIPLRNKNFRLRVLKEWFLMKICSIFEVGPHLEPYFGYDLLIFDECIQFGMERCKEISKQRFRNVEFYQNLVIIHKLHIMHQDLKTENIMFSPTFDRVVFIDFGLSAIISQTLGQKTLTKYVGCINFSSPQMNQCFLEKNTRLVDLYYNDLFGLQECLKVFSSRIEKFAQDQEQNGPQVQFQYLSLALGKFFLYKENYTFFYKLYNQYVKKIFIQTFINHFQNQIINFLQQLTPNTHLVQFFKSFVPDRYKETMIYQKLKIFYLISQKNCYSKQIFRNEDKHNRFNIRVSDLLQQADSQQIFNEQNISEFMMNRNLISQYPFEKYLDAYLDYISFFCNKYKTNKDKRIQAAKVYHKIWICQNISVQLQERKLVESTIRHALDWCLNQGYHNSQRQAIAMLFFKIYDFMVILDMGSLQDYLAWIDAIFNNKCLNQQYKKLFLFRVNQSLCLHQIRIIPKGHFPRYFFNKKLWNWVEQKKIEINLINDKLLMKDLQGLPSEFMLEFGFETVYSTTLRLILSRCPRNDDQKYFELYNSILSKQKHRRILFIMSPLYKIGAKLRDTKNLCTQIEKIFSQSIRDENIMSEFIFRIQNKLSKYTQIKNQQNTEALAWFKQLNNALEKIKDEDLYYYIFSITDAWNLAQQKQNKAGINLRFLYEGQGFLLKFILGYQKLLKEKLLNQKHPCTLTFYFFDLLSLSKKVSKKKEQQIIEIINNVFSRAKQCQQCIRSNHLIVIVNQIHNLIFKFKQVKDNDPKDNENINKVIQSFSDKYKQLYKYRKSSLNKQLGQQILVQKGLFYGSLFCLYRQQLENMFGGNIKYYDFLSQTKFIDVYFNISEAQISFKVILIMLKQKHPQKFIKILFQISEQLSKTLFLYKIYGSLQQKLSAIFKYCSHIQIQQLFNALKLASQNEYRENSYIIVIYSHMVNFVKNQTVVRKILIQIRKKIQNIDYHFQRQVAINILGKLTLIDAKDLSKRQWLYYNNKLIKLLKIADRTSQLKIKKSTKDSIFKLLLKQKTSRYGYCQNYGEDLRYKQLKKGWSDIKFRLK